MSEAEELQQMKDRINASSGEDQKALIRQFSVRIEMLEAKLNQIPDANPKPKPVVGP